MKNGLKIVVLTQFYKPEPLMYPPAVAESLNSDGFEVRVVTGYPNRPGGKLYKGYAQHFRQNEVIDGISVYRVPLIINHSRKAIERIANFLSFAFSALTLSLKIKDADAVYVYATPATAALPAQVWKKLFGIPYVLHVQDLWPESVTESGMMGRGVIGKLSGKLLSKWVDNLYGQADSLIAISPDMRQLLIDRGYAAEKVEVVFNWADESTVTPKEAGNRTADNTLNLVYAGNLGPMQDLDSLVQSLSGITEGQNISLTIAGGGVLESSLRKQSEGNESIRFVGLLSREEVNELYENSDFQLVTLKDLQIFRTNIPSKLQASLASATPVITTVKGFVANLIEEYDAGLVAEPEDPDSLRETILKAAELSNEHRVQMGRNARQLYDDLMSSSSGLAAISRIMSSVSREKLH